MTPDELRRPLERLGVVGPNEPFDLQPLCGGVASDIWLVHAAGRNFVIKRALEKLCVAADWHAPVDGSRLVNISRVQAVFPRTGESGQLDAGRARTRIRAEQSLDELVCIFADTGAMAQRGAVVDQDAHLFKSFRLSILLSYENCRRGNWIRWARGWGLSCGKREYSPVRR